MRRVILIFLVVIAVGGATGASAFNGLGGVSDVAGSVSSVPGSVPDVPPSLPSDVTCTQLANGGISCFYPAHDRGARGAN